MLLGAALRRLSGRAVRVTGWVSTTVLLCTAVGSFGVVAAAAPYPPSSPPCALSWSADTTRGSLLVGSGYDTNQPVTVTLFPQAETLGFYATNASGAFEAPVEVPEGPHADAVWVTATSPHRSCSVVPPSGGTQPPSTSTPSTGGSTPTAGGSTTPGGAGSGGSSNGGSGGGSGSGATSSPYPPSGSSSSPKTGTPGTSTSPAPASNAVPTGPTTTSRSPNADRSTRALGLSLSVIITIAVLLLLAGGLGVLVLTRRAS